MTQMREPNGRFAAKGSKTATKAAGTTGGSNKGKRRITVTTPSRLVNHFGIALDASGSMRSIQYAAFQSFKDNVQTIKEKSRSFNQKTTLSFITFGDPNVHVRLSGVDPSGFNTPYYMPYGQTPLYDAIGTTVKELEKLDDGKPTTSVVALIITDGGENDSRNWRLLEIQELLKQKQSTGRWSFVFLCPPGCKRFFENTFRIPLDNIREWEATEAGLQAATVSTQAGIGEFYATRSLGQTSTSCFYAPEGM